MIKRVLSVKILAIIFIFIFSGIGLAAISLKLVHKKVENLTYSPKLDKSYNILVLGSDSRTESFKGRADSIMLVRIDHQKDKIMMASFPRDSRVAIPGSGYNKINAAYVFGGGDLAVKTVENFSGVKIDGYVVTNFRGFIRAIDALEGVKINLETPIHDRFAGPFLNPGEQTMSGLKALAMARSRKAVKGGDFGRAANQQKIIKAVIEQEKIKSNMRAVVVKTIDLLSHVDTDLSLGELIKIGLFVKSIEESNISGVVLKGSTGMVGGASVVVLDNSFARQTFQNFK